MRSSPGGGTLSCGPSPPEDDPHPPGGFRRARSAFLPALLAGALLAGLAAGPGSGQEDAPEARRLPRFLPPAARRDDGGARLAIHRGLRFLARSQSARSGRIGSLYPVATTSLAGLAVLGAGIQPDQAPWGRLLEGCIAYLLQSADSRGYISEADRGDSGGAGSRMHGHCYAVLFLTQVGGSLPLTTERKVRAAVQRGVRVIERAQSDEGGWYYGPRNDDQLDEASVTICAVQALRAARNTGFRVDPFRIEQGISYVRRCQHDDGSVRYSLTMNQDRTSFSLTAAAASTLNAAGVYERERADEDAEVLRRALDWLHRELGRFPRHPERAVQDQFFWYGNLYAAQAFWQEGGAVWSSWYDEVRANILSEPLMRRVGEAARWRTPGGDSKYGDEYATAVALLILEIPLGYLPIHER